MPIKVKVELDLFTIKQINRLGWKAETEAEHDAVAVFRRKSLDAIVQQKSNDNDTEQT